MHQDHHKSNYYYFFERKPVGINPIIIECVQYGEIVATRESHCSDFVIILFKICVGQVLLT